MDWKAMLEEWCRINNKGEADFFMSSCQDNFTIKRRLAHWRQYKVLHPQDQEFLRKELKCGQGTKTESEGAT